MKDFTKSPIALLNEELLGLNEVATYGDHQHQAGNSPIFVKSVKPKDSKGIKAILNALEVLGLTKYDIIGYGYGAWEDKHGSAIFSHDLLLQIRGRTFYASPDGDKAEIVIPAESKAMVEIRVYK